MATEIGFPPSPLFKIAREEGEGVLVSRIRPVRNYGLGGNARTRGMALMTAWALIQRKTVFQTKTKI